MIGSGSARDRASSMSLSTLHEGTVMEAGATDSRLSGAAGQAYSRLPQDEEATHTAVNVPADSQRGPGNTLGMPPLHRSRSSTVSSIASDVSSVIVEPEPQPETPTTWKGRLQASRPILVAAGQFSALLLASLLFLYISIKLLLPPVKPEEAAKLKLPKSFEDLKDLNDVLQLYKESNYGNVLGSFVLVYLFLQCFSVPGSMYLSMIGGALFGLWALPLVCFCIATGASLCYIMSQLMGPALLASSSKWRHRVEKWTQRIKSHEANLISYLIVLRIAPLPPHWMVNIIAPHLGITFWMFWLSTFLGVCGVSYIHVQIGMTLDEMTSSDDFHLISLKNFLGLAGIVVAVLIPVAIRYAWASDLKDAAEQDDGEIALPASDEESAVPASALRPKPRRFRSASKLVFLDRDGHDLPARDSPQDERKGMSSTSAYPDDPYASGESIQLKESSRIGQS